MSNAKKLPEGASQHSTAGPYSPVLEVQCSKLVVISGQAALDADGNLLASDVAGQTRHTLLNCQRQLEAAGCTLDDVFKCNVFMTDLDHWDEMNEVYQEMMPPPRPVRTAVQARLLPGILVEIEMWAALS